VGLLTAMYAHCRVTPNVSCLVEALPGTCDRIHNRNSYLDILPLLIPLV